MSNVRQNLRPRTEKVSVPLVQTIPLVGIFLAAFSNLLVGIPLVGMCRRVVYMYTCAVEKKTRRKKNVLVENDAWARKQEANEKNNPCRSSKINVETG